jgi:tRNA(Ile)-lysidine synthase
VLHLLLAHHRDDQAETFLMRLTRGSGASGLACMSAVVETADLRILRPLLGVPQERLSAYLKKRRVGWIEDPSNRDPAYARIRIRTMLPALADAGLPPAMWADSAHRMARPRIAGEDACARLLARSATIHPEGYAIVEASELAGAPRDASLRALSRLLLCIGGGDFGPREYRLARLHGLILDDRLGRGRTLGGCRVLPLPAKVYGGNRILICREARPAPAPMHVRTGGRVVWDECFVVEIASHRRRGVPGLWLTRLGPEGWARIARKAPSHRSDPIPPPARSVLPALVDRDGVAQVPHLDYVRTDAERVPLRIERISFRPRHSLSDTGFFLA